MRWEGNCHSCRYDQCFKVQIDSCSSSLMCYLQLQSGLDCYDRIEGYCSMIPLMHHAIRVYVQR